MIKITRRKYAIIDTRRRIKEWNINIVGDHEEKELIFGVLDLTTKKLSKEWLINNGCMTYNWDLLKELNKTIIFKVIIGNGAQITLEDIEKIALKSGLSLKQICSVLYVPKINQNLLSVAQLLEKDYKVLFEHKIYLIKD
jgi:hypothetical protein